MYGPTVPPPPALRSTADIQQPAVSREPDSPANQWLAIDPQLQDFGGPSDAPADGIPGLDLLDDITSLSAPVPVPNSVVASAPGPVPVPASAPSPHVTIPTSPASVRSVVLSPRRLPPAIALKEALASDHSEAPPAKRAKGDNGKARGRAGGKVKEVPDADAPKRPKRLTRSAAQATLSNATNTHRDVRGRR